MSAPTSTNRRVLVVFERGRAGSEALRHAAQLASEGAELSVVTLAPQASPSRCCGPGPGPYNCAVREEAYAELGEARTQLGTAARQASFTVLAGTPSPPLAEWTATRGFDLILLPGHRLTPRGNRHAKSLGRTTRAEIRLT
jgi:nucleotide-binding universal stress UspA family protein